MADIHVHLKELRLEKSLTQSEVAERLGLSRQAISSYESGRTQPGVDLLMRFAEIYQVELEDILYGSREAQAGRRRVKYAAIIVAMLFLAVQIILYTFSDMPRFIIMQEDKYQISIGIEAIVRLVLNIGLLVVMIMDLSQKGNYSWKTKAGYCLILLGVSLFTMILFEGIHSYVIAIDHVFFGYANFASVTVCLLVDLFISAGKTKNCTFFRT